MMHHHSLSLANAKWGFLVVIYLLGTATASQPPRSLIMLVASVISRNLLFLGLGSCFDCSCDGGHAVTVSMHSSVLYPLCSSYSS